MHGVGVAKRALGIEMRLLAYDPYVQAENMEEGVSMMDLDEVVVEADFVSLRATRREETKHMIGAAPLKAMKPSAYLINTSRGALERFEDLHSMVEITKAYSPEPKDVDLYDSLYRIHIELYFQLGKSFDQISLV
jgi:D-3-phosphoglycerate dehydrogenase